MFSFFLFFFFPRFVFCFLSISFFSITFHLSFRPLLFFLFLLSSIPLLTKFLYFSLFLLYLSFFHFYKTKSAIKHANLLSLSQFSSFWLIFFSISVTFFLFHDIIFVSFMLVLSFYLPFNYLCLLFSMLFSIPTTH